MKIVQATKESETMPKLPAGRIDVHCHSVVPSYRKALEEANLGVNVRIPNWTPEAAIGVMDRHGIAASVVSISVPGTHLGDDAKAKELALRVNEEHADVCAMHPRLGAFATLPLPNVELACAAAEHALDVLKLDGVSLLESYEGKYLGHADYDPLFQVLDERSAVVFLHPAVHPSTKLISLRVPNFLLEYPFDTTRAAVNMVFADVMERFPNIKFILPHGGGTLPFLVWRISAVATWQMSQPPENERFLKDNFRNPLTAKYDIITPELMRSLFRRFWFDTALAPDKGALDAIRAIADPDKILFGSDWPYAYESFVADEIRQLSDPDVLPTELRAAVERENALRLFPRFT